VTTQPKMSMWHLSPASISSSSNLINLKANIHIRVSATALNSLKFRWFKRQQVKWWPTLITTQNQILDCHNFKWKKYSFSNFKTKTRRLACSSKSMIVLRMKKRVRAPTWVDERSPRNWIIARKRAQPQVPELPNYHKSNLQVLF